MNHRNRIPSEHVCYGLYLYFSGLSLRRASQRLSCFVKRNHVSIWNWIQKYKPTRVSSNRKRIAEHVIDETIIKVGSKYIWLWIAIESTARKEILGICISIERNMFVAERFISKLIKINGKRPISTDGGGTWYPQACRLLKIEHYLHSHYEISIIERTIQYVKDRTKGFDDYFPCRKKNVN